MRSKEETISLEPQRGKWNTDDADLTDFHGSEAHWTSDPFNPLPGLPLLGLPPDPPNPCSIRAGQRLARAVRMAAVAPLSVVK